MSIHFSVFENVLLSLHLRIYTYTCTLYVHAHVYTCTCMIVLIVYGMFLQARLTGIHGYDYDMTSHPITFRYDESTVK